MYALDAMAVLCSICMTRTNVLVSNVQIAQVCLSAASQQLCSDLQLAYGVDTVDTCAPATNGVNAICKPCPNVKVQAAVGVLATQWGAG